MGGGDRFLCKRLADRDRCHGQSVILAGCGAVLLSHKVGASTERGPSLCNSHFPSPQLYPKLQTPRLTLLNCKMPLLRHSVPSCRWFGIRNLTASVHAWSLGGSLLKCGGQLPSRLQRWRTILISTVFANDPSY